MKILTIHQRGKHAAMIQDLAENLDNFRKIGPVRTEIDLIVLLMSEGHSIQDYTNVRTIAYDKNELLIHTWEK